MRRNIRNCCEYTAHNQGFWQLYGFRLRVYGHIHRYFGLQQSHLPGESQPILGNY